VDVCTLHHEELTMLLCYHGPPPATLGLPFPERRKSKVTLAPTNIAIMTVVCLCVLFHSFHQYAPTGCCIGFRFRGDIHIYLFLDSGLHTRCHTSKNIINTIHLKPILDVIIAYVVSCCKLSLHSPHMYRTQTTPPPPYRY